MRAMYRQTTSTCHTCGEDITGTYYLSDEGVHLVTACPVHGEKEELIEKDVDFFRKAYEYGNYVPMKYLILPITYRCNLSCRYCYAHSNYQHTLPEDRSIDTLLKIIREADCPTVNLAGGEPTVRKDLPELLKRIKEETAVHRLCVVTNGQRTKDAAYLQTLHQSGMDFLFLPLHIPGYAPDSRVIANVRQSLDNAYELRVPVWIQATIDDINQIDDVMEILNRYHKIIFNITLRAARPYGVKLPDEMVHITDMLKKLNMQDSYGMGNHPFNRTVKLFGRKTKVSSWVNDRIMLDPYDALYVIHNNEILPFHKGMVADDLYFKQQAVMA